MIQKTTKQLWTSIINDARMYDGSPYMLEQLIRHFEKNGYSVHQKYGSDESEEFKPSTISKEDVIDGAKNFWQSGQKLNAVKAIYSIGYSLKDAKDYCENNF